jgi:hypothetical protein
MRYVSYSGMRKEICHVISEGESLGEANESCMHRVREEAEYIPK